VILAALGEPDVLLLDEPYQGLDLDSVQRFWDLLWAWRDGGRCAVVVSHAHDAIERADAVVELA
jgi:ABC-type multidrug transport system ATPase subunit